MASKIQLQFIHPPLFNITTPFGVVKAENIGFQRGMQRKGGYLLHCLDKLLYLLYIIVLVFKGLEWVKILARVVKWILQISSLSSDANMSSTWQFSKCIQDVNRASSLRAGISADSPLQFRGHIQKAENALSLSNANSAYIEAMHIKQMLTTCYFLMLISPACHKQVCWLFWWHRCVLRTQLGTEPFHSWLRQLPARFQDVKDGCGRHSHSCMPCVACILRSYKWIRQGKNIRLLLRGFRILLAITDKPEGTNTMSDKFFL